MQQSNNHQKLWHSIPANFQQSLALFEADITKLGKKNHTRTLMFTEKALLLFKVWHSASLGKSLTSSQNAPPRLHHKV